MDRGIINESLLEKDIKNIEFYSNEENKVLNKIYTKFNDCCNNYKSENTSMLINDNNLIKNIIDSLYNKRVRYTDILLKVILQYNNLSNVAKSKFNGDI